MNGEPIFRQRNKGMQEEEEFIECWEEKKCGRGAFHDCDVKVLKARTSASILGLPVPVT